MKNKTGHIIGEGLNKSALHKLAIFCSSHSLFKSDEELCSSFDRFFAGSHTQNDARKRLLNDLKAIEEILPVLYDLGEQPVAEDGQQAAGEIQHADSSNRLYASLKRHPE